MLGEKAFSDDVVEAPMTACSFVAKLRALGFALAAVASVAFGGIARADPTHERAGCETQAKSSFQDLTQEYISVLLNVKVRFEIIANEYQAAFSEKVNSCLLLVHKTASIDRKVSDTSVSDRCRQPHNVCALRGNEWQRRVLSADSNGQGNQAVQEPA